MLLGLVAREGRGSGDPLREVRGFRLEGLGLRDLGFWVWGFRV